jgi:hypothetical protein
VVDQHRVAAALSQHRVPITEGGDEPGGGAPDFRCGRCDLELLRGLTQLAKGGDGLPGRAGHCDVALGHLTARHEPHERPSVSDVEDRAARSDGPAVGGMDEFEPRSALDRRQRGRVDHDPLGDHGEDRSLLAPRRRASEDDQAA